MNLENISMKTRLMKRITVATNQPNKKVCCIILFKRRPRIGKHKESESKLVVTRAQEGRKEGKATANKYLINKNKGFLIIVMKMWK